MKRITFNPEISWGHLVQIVVALLAVVAFYTNEREFKTKMDLRVKSLEEGKVAQAVQAKEQASATRELSDAVIELSTVVGIQRRNDRFRHLEPASEQQQRKQP